jgi:hypothetical protein
LLAAVRPWNYTQRTVFKRDVLQHPQNVADPKTSLVGYRPHVCVQRLADVAARINASYIQAAEFVITEHALHVGKHRRAGDHASKHISFVKQVRQPAAAMFLLEFCARRITFRREQLIDPVVQLDEQIAIDRVWQNDMTEFIELFEKIVHLINRYGYWFRSVS